MRTDRVVYEIRVRGRLDGAWKEMFEGLSMQIDEGGDTRLTLVGSDQALLHGVLAHIAQRNLTLLSVRRREGASEC